MLSDGSGVVGHARPKKVLKPDIEGTNASSISKPVNNSSNEFSAVRASTAFLPKDEAHW